ncbi:MAG: LLM class flavin-dependent oxidoreductase [bacterium]
MTLLGVNFTPSYPPERLASVARAADAAGLDELWLWEDCFAESGIATATAALAVTERIGVGIGLLPVPLRNVALTAMEIATIERMFPGRLRPGIGHGVQSWMGQVGARVESPLTLLREYAEALRHLLDGERVTVSGRYVQLDDVVLDWPPGGPVALHAGGVKDRTIRLCGEVADGTILVGGLTPEAVHDARSMVDAAAADRGRAAPHRLTVFCDAPFAQPSVDVIADLVGSYAGAGADAVIVTPAAGEDDLERFVAFVAGQVRAALDGS